MKTIKDKTILKHLTNRGDLVDEGRELSKKIERIEAEIATLDKKEREYTVKCEPKELIEEGEKLKKEINERIEKLEKIGKKIEDEKIASIPKEMYDKHYKLRDEKEKLERDRNKVALKLQKIKDRVAMLVNKKVKPELDEYEDVERVEIKGDELIVHTYNRIEEFKKTLKG